MGEPYHCENLANCCVKNTNSIAVHIQLPGSGVIQLPGIYSWLVKSWIFYTLMNL